MANDVEVFQTPPVAFVQGMLLMEIVNDMLEGRCLDVASCCFHVLIKLVGTECFKKEKFVTNKIRNKQVSC